MIVQKKTTKNKNSITKDPKSEANVNNDESKWRKTSRIMNKADKKKSMAKVLELAIMGIMNNHYYEFGGCMYKQGKGGAISL